MDGMIYNGRQQQPVLPDVRKTVTVLDRTRGLLGTRALAGGQGLLISPCNAVHTFFMRFSIDVIFLDRDGAIVKIIQALKPFRLGMALGAAAVLEVRAGEADRTGLRPGDRLSWVEA